MRNNIFICIVIFIALLGGIAGGILYYKNSANSTDVLLQYDLEPLDCELLKKPCSVDFISNQTNNIDKITFDINPRPVVVMNKSTITISNLHYDFYDPKIRIHGLNMDMGTIIASLIEIAPNTFQASVALSACLVENIMRYRIAVYDGNSAINLFMDFDIER